MDIAIMIEGQMGVNWPRWKRLVRAVEDLGFAGLYRSDHFVNPNPPDDDSLELWMSLAWLADNTSRITFGPLVSPVSFRHPAMTARMATAVDDLSGGRLVLGVGAGWQEREHTSYSYDLLGMPERFARFEEALHYFTGVLKSGDPFTLDGTYYQFREAVLLPRPARPGGPPILIGGNGPRRTLPLVAKYADEWNAVYQTTEQFATKNALLNELLEQAGRDAATVRRSIMLGLAFGKDDAAVRAMLKQYGADSVADVRKSGVIAGTPSEVQEQLGELAAVGIEGVMLQWFNLDDLDGLEAFAKAVL